MPAQPSLPHSPACRLDTRGPDGKRWRLNAQAPVWVDTAPNLPALPLAEALTRLKGMPDGLLVGVLPFPDTRPTAGGTPATLYLFETHRRLDPEAAPTTADNQGFRLTYPFHPDQARSDYIQGVRRVLEYLAAGDAYQVNLAQRFTAHYSGNPYTAYEMLRMRFDPPFAAWVDMGDRQLLCLSPESFLEVHGSLVTTRPIKGTRPRHPDPDTDRRLAEDLRTHPKDRAENLMIVDLLRNDLGKVCLPGTVRTPSLFEVHSYENVHHMISTVSGQLSANHSLIDLLAAAFPGGSITGAPKRRAMEIIAELEPHPRDVYCGSIFWALPDGTFGSNITIRSFVARDGLIHGWAGAGIVADSDPEKEYQECLHKLQPLMRALESLR